jgi:hypothetical protein
MSTRRERPGTFLRIPLSDGSFGYGRVLEHRVAFYDFRTTEPSSDLDTIAAKPMLFALSVRRRPGRDKWVGIGEKPLEGEVAKPTVAFLQDVADFRNCVIFDDRGTERKASPEECIGLERSAVWEPHHVEERLLDTFMGRPNAAEMHLRVRLKAD